MKTTHRFLALIISSVAVIVIIEELSYGNAYFHFANHYESVIYKPIKVKRSEHVKVNIGLTIIMEQKEDEKKYEMALDTVRCYARYFKYDLHIISVSENLDLVEQCQHKDFMFRRHCVLSTRMAEMHNDWILFLDADMGIVNPNNLIERYVPENNEKAEIVFYNRIMNQEIMAGSYLVKNSEWSRKFLMFWADYEKKLPKSFHGTDNGAIHSAIVEFGLPHLKILRQKCEEKYWSTSKDYMGLSYYEVCMQNILKKNDVSKVKILKKGRLSWARDGWLTNSLWSESDFVLHGWQKRRQDKLIFAMWHSPLVYDRPFNLSICDTSNAYINWKYKNTFIGEIVDIDRTLMARIEEQENEFNRVNRLIA